VDQHLGDRGAAGLLDRDGEIDHLPGSGRGAVGSRDRDAVDEDHAQIGVLGGAGGRDRGLGAGRKHRLEGGIRNMEVELHAGFRALLHQGLGMRQRAPRQQHPSAAAEVFPIITHLPFRICVSSALSFGPGRLLQRELCKAPGAT